jgi:hypothetical protein
MSAILWVGAKVLRCLGMANLVFMTLHGIFFMIFMRINTFEYHSFSSVQISSFYVGKRRSCKQKKSPENYSIVHHAGDFRGNLECAQVVYK